MNGEGIASEEKTNLVAGMAGAGGLGLGSSRSGGGVGLLGRHGDGCCGCEFRGKSRRWLFEAVKQR